MNPSCHFREWSSTDARQLLKVKGTIQDIDGECSLKVTGESHKGCPIAPHYRLPLYTLNKKFGIYRKVMQNLQDTCSEDAAHLQNTYLSVMRYLNDVRIAFLDDAGVCSDALQTDFRSAALDHYLWLDHTASGFHDESRTALDTVYGVTFEGLKNGKCPDILVSHFPLVLDLDDNEPLDNLFNNGFMVVGCTPDEFFEILGMGEMMATSHKISMDRGVMTKIFITIGCALYMSRLGKEYVVEYGPMLGLMEPIQNQSCDSSGKSTRVVILCQTDDDGTPQDINMQLESPIAVNVGVQYDFAMNDSIVHAPHSVLHVSDLYQPNDEAPVNPECDYTFSQHCEQDLNEYHIDDTGCFPPSSHCSDCGDAFKNASVHLAASLTASADVSHTSSPSHNESIIVDINPLHEWHGRHGRNTALDIGHPPVLPPLKSRLRQSKHVCTTTTPAVTQQRQSSQHGRPVIFAPQRPVPKGKANVACHPVESQTYTIQDLVSESEMCAQSVMPCIVSFLMDPHGLDFF
ncbi:hypothetical protein BDR03DRAFT_983108 [Suillus americanus]|nr:hypothetical protein BDR03DRAFT_983108 [Suillus americanus]